MPEAGKIHGALVRVMREAKAIGKGSRNQQQGFNFRGIDAVMNHLHPLFAAHGVVILPNVIEDRTEERQTKSGGTLLYRILKIRFDFTAEDGSTASATVIGEGMDSGDKASNKAMAVGLKYALTQLLLLPYDEVDPDADTPPPSERKAAPPPEVRDDLDRMMAPRPAPKAAPQGEAPRVKNPDAPATDPQRKKLYAMCKARGWTEEQMKIFMDQKTGKKHSKDLTMGEIQALYTALEQYARESGEVPPGREPGDE